MNPEAVYKLFAGHKEARWIMKPLSAQQLYDFVEKSSIETVLDLGTGIGCTAAILATAFKNTKRKGEIHTVEDKKKCIDIAKDLIPKDLQEYITFHHSETSVWRNRDIPHITFSKFKKLPEGKFDLILVDGPGPWFDKEGKYVDLPNGDAMRLLKANKLKKGSFVAWDGRKMALQLLERFYSANFFLVHQGTGTDFNVLQRKDNKVQLGDILADVMKEQGYE